MTKKCACELCELSDLRDEALKSKDIEFVKNVMDQFANLWIHADFDRCYYHSILEGDWPSAEKILTKSLEKAKEWNKEHPNDR